MCNVGNGSRAAQGQDRTPPSQQRHGRQQLREREHNRNASVRERTDARCSLASDGRGLESGPAASPAKELRPSPPTIGLSRTDGWLDSRPGLGPQDFRREGGETREFRL